MSDASLGNSTHERASRRILPLPANAVSQIHSSKHITTLQEAVLVLVENSLDAGATRVNVEVCFQRGDCLVEDDGHGIDSSEFSEAGGLGKVHHTSKRNADGSGEGAVHGNSGNSLASLAVQSVLTVVSLARGNESVGSMTMHRGKVINGVNSPTGDLSSLRIDGQHGTSVRVQDLFGNMPVRVKQRAVATATGTGHDKAWRELKHRIVELLVSWHKPCSIRIRNLASNGSTFAVGGTDPRLPRVLNKTNLRKLSIDCPRSGREHALNILYQAGLAPLDTRHRWEPVIAATMKANVRGIICLDAAPSKHAQFISIGVRPCDSVHYNRLYEAVNRTFTNSDFGVMEYSEWSKTANDVRKSGAYSRRRMQNKKGIDRWPMFILKIELKGGIDVHAVHWAKETQSTFLSVLDVLQAMSEQWLTKHDFGPRAKRTRAGKPPHSTHTASLDLPYRQTAKQLLNTLRIPRESSMTKRRGCVGLVSNSENKAGTSGPNGNGYSIALTSHFSVVKAGAISTRPSTISHIRSSRCGADENYPTNRRAESAPGGHVTSVSLHQTRRADAMFAARTVEPGELTRLSAQREGISFQTRPHYFGIERSTDCAQATISSDYFDNIEDEDLMDIEHTGIQGDMPMERYCGDLETVGDGVMQWMDPRTKLEFSVNNRTGAVLQSNFKTPSSVDFQPPEAASRQTTMTDVAKTATGLPLRLSKRLQVLREGNGGTPSWISQCLHDWENPVFAQQTEERIPSAVSRAPDNDLTGAHQACSGVDETHHWLATTERSVVQVSKAALSAVRIIKQVDEKFILCAMPAVLTGQGKPPSEYLIVLVDQHAASERIILEELFNNLCRPVDRRSLVASLAANTGCVSTVDTTQMSQPLRYGVAREEYELFIAHAGHFAIWGILYDLYSQDDGAISTSDQPSPGEDHFSIAVLTLPSGISERCKQYPALLIQILRSEVWSLADGQSRTKVTVDTLHDDFGEEDATDAIQDEDGEHAWVPRIGDCPRGIVEMLNSRACRSAIMFNDPLTISQCEQLLLGLSKCAFPFSCAHGRCSMVPLARVGGNAEQIWNRGEHFGGGTQRNTPAEDSDAFTQVFRTWQGRRTYSTGN